MFNYNNNSGYGYNPYYQREEQLNISIDSSSRTITISKIFDPKKTNPIYKFTLEIKNEGMISSPQFYSLDDIMTLTTNSKSNTDTKEITIPFSHTLDLCFIKLYINMQKYNSNSSAYKKLVEVDSHIKSISYRFSIFGGIINETGIILQFYDDAKESKLLIYDADPSDSIYPHYNPLKRIINQCMRDINNPSKTPSKTKKKNTTKKEKL